MNTNITMKIPDNENAQRIAIEQYKILVESLNKLNETRENSNNLWMGANGMGISALAYLRDSQSISQYHKPYLLLTIIGLGMLFCLTWLNYLWTIKKSLEARNVLLIELEKNFPFSVFSKIFIISDKKYVRAVLTFKEMIVPSIFLMGYIFFLGLLYFFPNEVIS
jgi:hypothetical protein